MVHTSLTSHVVPGPSGSYWCMERMLRCAGLQMVAATGNQTCTYCTSLRASTSHFAYQGQPLADNPLENEKAAATGGCNGQNVKDRYSRRPGFSGTQKYFSYLRQHLSPHQTPKENIPALLQSRSPTDILKFCHEARLLNPSTPEYLSIHQSHEAYCPLQSPLTGNWTTYECDTGLVSLRIATQFGANCTQWEWIQHWTGNCSFFFFLSISGVGARRQAHYQVAVFSRETNTETDSPAPRPKQPWVGHVYNKSPNVYTRVLINLVLPYVFVTSM